MFAELGETLTVTMLLSMTVAAAERAGCVVVA